MLLTGRQTDKQTEKATDKGEKHNFRRSAEVINLYTTSADMPKQGIANVWPRQLKW